MIRLLCTFALCLPLAAWAAPPAAVVPDGSLDYYRARAADFLQRNPGANPPDYYLDFGDVYVRRFTFETRPLLSPAGQRWMDDARVKLQEAIEARRSADPDGFARLELESKAFRRFAYATHAPAYASGLDRLPLRDLILIGTTPDAQDTLSREGLEQLAHVISGLGRSCRAQGLSSCVVQRVLVEREDLRRRLRDRLGIPSAVGTARFLWHRFADSVARTLGLDPHRDPALIDALR
ncbi:MAG: hypothetical protein R3F62_27695 [Planctomycetota bacterium]